MLTITQLRKKRADALAKLEALVAKDGLFAEELRDFDALEREVRDCDAEIERVDAAQLQAGVTAQPVAGQEGHVRVEAADDPYASDECAARMGFGRSRSLVVGAMARMCAVAGGNPFFAQQMAQRQYGERHPVTRALEVSVGSSGGFIVPPDYMNEIVELLRPLAVVRAAGPRVIPMPRGTMTLPAQTSPATASYGTETAKISSSQQGVGQITASFKKLTALVPVTNDMMRFASPAADAFVRDDLVKVIALREDLAFLMGDGTQASPMGFTAFASRYAVNTGGAAPAYSSTADSVWGTGGNFVTSNETYDLSTAASELGGLPNKLDTANVVDLKRVWFMHPRTFNYLFNVQNSLGVYVYRDELTKGLLLGYPVKRSTQIPINLWDASGTNRDCSLVILTEMTEAMIFDSMSLELAVSREGTYVDSGGNTVSAFQSDQTLIRAIAEHDFQIRHDASTAVLQGVRWAPAIS